MLVEKEKEATKRFLELKRQVGLYEKAKEKEKSNKAQSSPLTLDIEMSQITDIFRMKRARRPSKTSTTRPNSPARTGNDDSYSAEENHVEYAKKDKSRKWAHIQH